MIDPARLEIVKSICLSASELEPEARDAFVQERAAGDQEIVREVLSLLPYYSGEFFVQSPSLRPASTALNSREKEDPASPDKPVTYHVAEAAANGGAAQFFPLSVRRSDDWYSDRIGSYRVLECIGRGGMGVVYKAIDERSGQFVALKTLQASAALDRFKREFRTFAGIHHPNLVELYDLVADGERWCFTMEFVEGRPFIAYVAGNTGGESKSSSLNSAAKIVRLRNAFRQLAGGVAEIHAAGKFHRDLKPSNVLVTAEHRVVILDFGLGVEQDASGMHRTEGGRVFCSVAYASPEQAMSCPISAASDWYSVGVMLYEALTGCLPFEGDLFAILDAKKGREPDPPARIALDVPDDLNALCIDLLRRDPAHRPDGSAILARFGAPCEPIAGVSPSAPHESLFVGRTQELSALRDAHETMRGGQPVIVYIEGHSGAGKTALAHCFLREIARDPRAIILTGRCHEHELVPFKALDNLIDNLARYLDKLDISELRELIPRYIRSLALVFRVFRGIADKAGAPRVGSAEIAPPELRRRAAAALRDLLTRLGDRHPLYLFIDDLHWGDTDSASLLTDLLRPPDPPVFLGLCCCRSEDTQGSAFFSYLRESRGRVPVTHDERHIKIGQLGEEETRELTLRLMGSSGGETAVLVEGIARESAGRPFLVYELIEHLKASKEGRTARLPLGLNEVLGPRIASLPEPSRTLLEIVAISGRPIDLAVARRAARISSDDRVVLQPLKAARLIRSTLISAEPRIEVYHDRVRQSVLNGLPPEALQKRHRQLADALGTSDHVDAEVMAHHLHQGGLPDDAAEYYAQAALAAANALAFEHAADLYRSALALKAWDREKSLRLHARLGDSLRNAGRGADAAREYLAAAASAAGAQALELQHQAALAFLTGGHVDEGLSRLGPVLESAGIRLAGAPWRALVSLLARRLQLRLRGSGFVERKEELIPPQVLRRIDIGWSVVLGLSVIDPIRGADFQARTLLLALRAGEPFRVARALAAEAGHLASSGDVVRARVTLAEAERLARILKCSHSDRMYADAMVKLAGGTVAYFECQWNRSFEYCKSAAETFRENCTGTTWEIDTANAFRLWSLAKMGNIAELADTYPAILKGARERGDLYAVTNLSTYVMVLVRLAAGGAASVRDELDEAVGKWSQKGYHVQHHDALLAYVPLELYGGDPTAAWNRVQAACVAFRWSFLSQIQNSRIEMLQLRSYCALAMAASTKDRSRFLAVAAHDARRLRKEKLTWSSALAEYVLGVIAYLKNDSATALRRLSGAAAAFDSIDARLHAAVTRKRLSGIPGCQNAVQIRTSADAWFHSQGVKNTDRMLCAYAPGFAD